MSFSVAKTVWLNNGYGVEFVVTDPFAITFHIVTAKDLTMVDSCSITIGTDSCIRAGDEESLTRFAVRARKEGMAYAEEMIVEHKESLKLSTILDEVLKDDSSE